MTGVRPSRRARDTRALLTNETSTGVEAGDDTDWDTGIYTPVPTDFGVPAVTYGTPAEGAADEAIRTDAVLPGPPIVVLTLTNKSGGSVAAGDVVVIDTANDTAFTTTTTGQAEVSVGIAQATIASNASGRVLVSGYAALVNVPSSMTRGRYLETHTVVKQATGSATRRAGSFGQFLTAGTTPSAWLWGQTDQTASGGGATITTQDEGGTLSSTVTTVNFTGAGVTASGAGATTTVNIPGGGSSSIPEQSVPYPTSATGDDDLSASTAGWSDVGSNAYTTLSSDGVVISALIAGGGKDSTIRKTLGTTKAAAFDFRFGIMPVVDYWSVDADTYVELLMRTSGGTTIASMRLGAWTGRGILIACAGSGGYTQTHSYLLHHTAMTIRVTRDGSNVVRFYYSAGSTPFVLMQVRQPNSGTYLAPLTFTSSGTVARIEVRTVTNGSHGATAIFGAYLDYFVSA